MKFFKQGNANSEMVSAKTSLFFFKAMNEGLKNFICEQKNVERIIFYSIGLFIVVVTLITISSIGDLKNSNNQTTSVMRRQLNDIDAQLQTLSSTSSNSSAYQSAWVSLSNDISSIKKSINDVAKTSDVQQISHQLTSVKADVDEQILDIKRTVSNGSANKQYVDASQLPFQVISIDVIAEQPYVSVDYANHIMPLAVGDRLAGWTVVSADYDVANVELKNAQDQYVKVSLQG